MLKQERALRLDGGTDLEGNRPVMDKSIFTSRSLQLMCKLVWGGRT